MLTRQFLLCLYQLTPRYFDEQPLVFALAEDRRAMVIFQNASLFIFTEYSVIPMRPSLPLDAAAPHVLLSHTVGKVQRTIHVVVDDVRVGSACRLLFLDRCSSKIQSEKKNNSIFNS
jgi:hypothetical protein